jgi:hypothetical protein
MIHSGKVIYRLLIGGVFLMALLAGCGGGGNDGTPITGDTTTDTTAPPVENFSLKVDKFGEGIIVSDKSGISCGSDCFESYPANTPIVLIATPDSGYQFSSWLGCDSATDNTCTITINSDKTILPTFALKETILQSNTKVLDDTTMNSVVKQEGLIYYFDSQTTTAKNLQSGDVIVSKSGTGMIRKVKSVSTSSDDGSIVVETELATLEDAIKEGTVAYSGTLTHGDLMTTKSLVSGQ